jgi:hypothetical protein
MRVDGAGFCVLGGLFAMLTMHGVWLGAFLDAQNSAAAQAAVHAWLAQKSLDPELRLKALEVSDALDRTVLIRQRFPE